VEMWTGVSSGHDPWPLTRDDPAGRTLAVRRWLVLRHTLASSIAQLGLGADGGGAGAPSPSRGGDAPLVRLGATRYERGCRTGARQPARPKFRRPGEFTRRCGVLTTAAHREIRANRYSPLEPLRVKLVSVYLWERPCPPIPM
jgi:hypothetical protein